MTEKCFTDVRSVKTGEDVESPGPKRRRRRRSHERERERERGDCSNGAHESVSDSTKNEGAVPDLCVICLEQNYNAVFVPCGHMCCCTACSSHLSSCPLCRRRIDQVVKTYRH